MLRKTKPRRRFPDPRTIPFPFARLPPKSAAARIAKVKNPEFEMSWYRSKPGELRPSAVIRTTSQLLKTTPQPFDKSNIHTHPSSVQRDRFSSGAYPSVVDLRDALFRIKDSNLRFWHIASTNNRGEVIGYFTMYASPNFKKRVTDEDISKLEDDWGKSSKETHTQQSRRWLKKLGISFRVTPMQGYHLVKGRFVRKFVK